MTVNMLRYKGYEGSVDCDFSDNLLTGRVLGVRCCLVYEAQTLIELQKAFGLVTGVQTCALPI